MLCAKSICYARDLFATACSIALEDCYFLHLSTTLHISHGWQHALAKLHLMLDPSRQLPAPTSHEHNGTNASSQQPSRCATAAESLEKGWRSKTGDYLIPAFGSTTSPVKVLVISPLTETWQT